MEYLDLKFNYMYVYSQAKQLGAVKKGTAKQSRINVITEYDW